MMSFTFHLSDMIHLVLYRILKFVHTHRWHMPKSESTLEDERQNLLWHLKIKTDCLIPARIPDIVIIKKTKSKTKKERTCLSMGVAVPADYKVKNQRIRKKRQILRSCQRTKKALKRDCGDDTNCNWRTWREPQWFSKITRDENQRAIGESSSNVELSQNTEKSPGDLGRLAVLIFHWKTRKE